MRAIVDRLVEDLSLSPDDSRPMRCKLKAQRDETGKGTGGDGEQRRPNVESNSSYSQILPTFSIVSSS